jgi:resolvase-like protein
MPFSVIFRGAGFNGVQMGQSAALYCRVSTADQTCARQERDLRAFAKKAGYKVAGVWKETASGTKDERAEREKVLALAQARYIDTILVTELTRWGRSMLHLFHTLQDLQAWGRLTGRSNRLAVRSAHCPGQINRYAREPSGNRPPSSTRASPGTPRRSRAW